MYSNILSNKAILLKIEKVANLIEIIPRNKFIGLKTDTYVDCNT